jgi:hypothetical protein
MKAWVRATDDNGNTIGQLDKDACWANDYVLRGLWASFLEEDIDPASCLRGILGYKMLRNRKLVADSVRDITC